MIEISGRYYDGQSARAVDMLLRIAADGTLQAEPPLFPPGPLPKVKLDSRISGLPAVLRFPWGGVFETHEHDAVEAAFGAIGRSVGLTHRLESRTSYAIAAVLFTFVFMGAAYFWGVPALSKVVTPLLPADVGVALGDGALEQLDRYIFDESTLSRSRKTQLSALFDSLHRNAGIEPRPTLHFREGGLLNANALALPNGAIVLTDELVALAANDKQIAAVLLHELGHVRHRHTLQQMLNQSSVAALTFLLIGDVSTISSLIVAVPTVLIETSFSRGMELEADAYAIDNAVDRGLDISDLADMLARLDRYHRTCRPMEGRDGPVAADECMARGNDGQSGEDEYEDDWTSYASTHPATAERIARIRAAAQR